MENPTQPVGDSALLAAFALLTSSTSSLRSFRFSRSAFSRSSLSEVIPSLPDTKHSSLRHAPRLSSYGKATCSLLRYWRHRWRSRSDIFSITGVRGGRDQISCRNRSHCCWAFILDSRFCLHRLRRSWRALLHWPRWWSLHRSRGWSVYWPRRRSVHRSWRRCVHWPRRRSLHRSWRWCIHWPRRRCVHRSWRWCLYRARWWRLLWTGGLATPVPVAAVTINGTDPLPPAKSRDGFPSPRIPFN